MRIVVCGLIHARCVRVIERDAQPNEVPYESKEQLVYIGIAKYTFEEHFTNSFTSVLLHCQPEVYQERLLQGKSYV